MPEIAEGERDALHSELPESGKKCPHTCWWGPVYNEAQNPSSGIVAAIGGGGPWDVSAS